mgnify:CR=1 FL=1
MENLTLNFKKTLTGEYIAKFNKYEFKIYKGREVKVLKLDLLNKKTGIMERQGLYVGILRNNSLRDAKELAAEMLRNRLKDKNHFKKMVETEIQLIKAEPKSQDTRQELMRLKGILAQLESAA